MSVSRIGRVTLLATLFLACTPSSETADEEGNSGAAAVSGATGNTHLLAIAKCDKVHEKAATTAQSTMDMIGAEAGYTSCAKAANDAAVAQIEANLKESESQLIGKAASLIADFRAASDALSIETDKASDNFGGSLSRVEAAGSRAERERFLASLIDSYVQLGEGSISISSGAADHATCYRKWNKRLDESEANQDMVQANYALGDCIAKRLDLLSTPLAKVQIGNDPAVGAEAAVSKTISDITKAYSKAGADLCVAFSDAGPMAGGSGSRLFSSTCSVRVSEHAFRAIHVFFDK